jgi:hypothetical protein
LLKAIIVHLFVVFAILAAPYSFIFNDSCKKALKPLYLLREKAHTNPNIIFFVANIWGKMGQIQA